jgi:hypothetical protein
MRQSYCGVVIDWPAAYVRSGRENPRMFALAVEHAASPESKVCADQPSTAEQPSSTHSTCGL